MKICTINIPDKYLDCLETLVNLGYFPSRSEAVRVALKQFLDREQDINENMKVDQFKALKTQQMESMIH